MAAVKPSAISISECTSSAINRLSEHFQVDPPVRAFSSWPTCPSISKVTHLFEHFQGDPPVRAFPSVSLVLAHSFSCCLLSWNRALSITAKQLQESAGFHHRLPSEPFALGVGVGGWGISLFLIEPWNGLQFIICFASTFLAWGLFCMGIFAVETFYFTVNGSSL